MGNIGSSGSNNRRRHGGGGSGRRVHPPVTPPPPPPPDGAGNRFVYPAGAPPYQNYPNYYPPPPGTVPMPLPAPYDHHHRQAMDPISWRYQQQAPVPAPYVEHQKAVTIKNDVNIKKETLVIEPDEENPGFFLVTFTFDATVSGR